MTSPDDLLWKLTAPTRLGEKPTLDRMRQLLAELGRPERGLPVLHIGGTSGKGSTATVAAQILQAAGYRVGLHVKPHLERVEERFVVDGRPIETSELADLLEAAAQIAVRIRPTWYELTVAMALKHFRNRRVDVAVVEVGLGGTHDGTNVVEPIAAVLTNVDLDHTEILGDTVEQIARDKVGIVKSHAPTITGVSQPTVRAIVEARCREVGSPLWEVGRDVNYAISSLDPRGSRFDLRLPTRQLVDLRLRLRGAHQVANAALAVASVEALTPAGYIASEEAVRCALSSVDVPGRLEVARDAPLVLLDGAHNPAKMSALVDALGSLYADRPAVGVLGFKRGHDLAATLGTIAPRLRRAILTRFDADTDHGRGQSVEPKVLERICSEVAPSLERVIEPDPVCAIERAMVEARSGELICVTGSLYLVGAVRRHLVGGA